MANNAPAFQYYPADLIADPEVMFWNMEQIGAYWQMINFLWLNGGKFEFNSENLRKLFRKKSKKTTEKLWKTIEKKFVLENNIVTHKRILKEMQKQEISRSKRSLAGKRGMQSRWAKDNNSDNNVNNNDTEKTITKDNLSISTPIPTSSSINKNNTKRKSEEVLELELNKTKIAEFELGLHAFLPARTIGEKKTYRRLFEHVANQIKAGKLDFTVFDRILELAKKANVEADNPRAWWMYQCKKLTGFEGQSEPKRTKNFDQKKQEALKNL